MNALVDIGRSWRFWFSRNGNLHHPNDKQFVATAFCCSMVTVWICQNLEKGRCRLGIIPLVRIPALSKWGGKICRLVVDSYEMTRSDRTIEKGNEKIPSIMPVTNNTIEHTEEEGPYSADNHLE